jgi:hypothetical protein
MDALPAGLSESRLISRGILVGVELARFRLSIDLSELEEGTARIEGALDELGYPD